MRSGFPLRWPGQLAIYGAVSCLNSGGNGSTAICQCAACCHDHAGGVHRYFADSPIECGPGASGTGGSSRWRRDQPDTMAGLGRPATTARGSRPQARRVLAAARIRYRAPPRDPRGLRALATAVSVPASRSYRHFLRPAQLAARFGQPLATVGSVDAALRDVGLAPGPVSANDLVIPVATRWAGPGRSCTPVLSCTG